MDHLRFAKSYISNHEKEPTLSLHFLNEKGSRIVFTLDEGTAESVKNAITHFQKHKRK